LDAPEPRAITTSCENKCRERGRTVEGDVGGEEAGDGPAEEGDAENAGVEVEGGALGDLKAVLGLEGESASAGSWRQEGGGVRGRVALAVLADGERFMVRHLLKGVLMRKGRESRQDDVRV
jgi:hypothetical protein